MGGARRCVPIIGRILPADTVRAVRDRVHRSDVLRTALHRNGRLGGAGNDRGWRNGVSGPDQRCGHTHRPVVSPVKRSSTRTYYGPSGPRTGRPPLHLGTRHSADDASGTMLSVLGLRPRTAAGAILCFHSVTTPESPSRSDIHVSLQKFKSLIAAARGIGHLVPLRDLVRRHFAGRSTAGLISITADDAYASLLGETADFLRREAIPLTVFVVAQAAALGGAFWWDRVDDLFPHVSTSRWRAFEDAAGLPPEYRNRHLAPYGPLRPLRQWILSAFTGRWPSEL